MEHIAHVCPPTCDNPYCNICQGGLFSCKVCGLLEGSLTTDCPGYQCYASHSDAVYGGFIDYRNGAWTEDLNPTNQLWEKFRKEVP